MKTFEDNPPDVNFTYRDADHISATLFDYEEAILEEDYFDQALTITLRSTQDGAARNLERLLLKTDSCTVSIPEIDLCVPEGKARFCTVKEFIEEVYDNLKERLNNSSVLLDMKKIVDGELAFSLVLEDPLGNSRVQCMVEGDQVTQNVGLQLYDNDSDVEYKVYKRSLKVDVDYGIPNTNPLYQAVTGEEGISMAIDLINKASNIVGFTGAGVSTESGVPAFRNVKDYSTNEEDKSIWDTFDANMFQYANIIADEKVRTAYFVMHQGVRKIANNVEPNPSHFLFAELHKRNKLLKLITQNIDGLHQRAGVPDDKIIELHGSLHRIKCQSCGVEETSDKYFEELGDILEKNKGEFTFCPSCNACGGILKVSTISFGQNLEESSLVEAFKSCAMCDLMIVMGSSLVVSPANKLPLEAIDNNIPVILMNIGETSYDTIVTVLLKGKCGQNCREIIDQLSPI